ncbi:MAG: hypothetical protein ACRDRW_00490 [Pseudonocardiaceae bacterium]
MSTDARADPGTHPEDEGLDGSCPGCGAATGVLGTTGTAPTVRPWSCTTCGLNWAMFVANPHLRPPHPADLAAATEQVEGLRRTLQLVRALPRRHPPSPSGSRETECTRCAVTRSPAGRRLSRPVTRIGTRS